MISGVPASLRKRSLLYNFASWNLTSEDLTTGEMRAYRTARDQRESREREFTRLYTECYGFVYNYVRSRMPGDDAAEDVVADAFLQAARHFDEFDSSRAKFSTWVIKIASNVMISHWRRTKPVTTLDEVPQRLVTQPAEQDQVADRDLVDNLLSALDDTERQLVVMKYREGYRNIEIAEELGMNPSTVSTKLANALAKMRAVAERAL